MARYYFNIFADYFMFELLDDGVDSHVISVDQEALSDRIIVSDSSITIMTARNMNVPVLLEIYASPLDEKVDTQTWDHVVECSLQIDSGRLVISGTTDYYPACPRISVEPGIYEVRIFHGGLNTLSEDGLDGNDVYWIVLGPGRKIEKKVLKRFG